MTKGTNKKSSQEDQHEKFRKIQNDSSERHKSEIHFRKTFVLYVPLWLPFESNAGHVEAAAGSTHDYVVAMLKLARMDGVV
jgi:hypothetical protein